MHCHDTVINLAAVAIPLSGDTDSVLAALGRGRLIDQPDGLRIFVFLDHELLAAVSHLLFIPLNRFEEPL